ncbi:hypothetical protein OROGR_006309 [Orobanche gracilis]
MVLLMELQYTHVENLTVVLHGISKRRRGEREAIQLQRFRHHLYPFYS